MTNDKESDMTNVISLKTKSYSRDKLHTRLDIAMDKLDKEYGSARLSSAAAHVIEGWVYSLDRSLKNHDSEASLSAEINIAWRRYFGLGDAA